MNTYLLGILNGFMFGLGLFLAAVLVRATLHMNLLTGG